MREKGYGTEKLKAQVIKMFREQVGFWHPKNRKKSEIIYSELIPTGQMIEEGIGNQEISEESDTDFENDHEKEDNEAKHLYHSEKLLRSIVTDKRYTVPWPPVSDNVIENNTGIPDLLYSFLAWLLSDDDSTDPAVSAQKVSVSDKIHQTILSLGQDFIFNATSGRIKTPKHIALPMTIKSNYRMRRASDTFKPTESWHFLHLCRGTEKNAMVMRQVRGYEAGSFLPSNAQSDVYSQPSAGTTRIWRTHCLEKDPPNGIMIQPKFQMCQERPILATTEARCIHRAFEMPPTEIRTTSNQSLLIKLQRKHTFLSPYSYKDNSWMLSRFNPSADIFTPNQEESQQIAAWTAFNVNTCQDNGVSERVVGYCQVIDSSPTEIPTVYTVPKRSVQIADQSSQQDVIVVFDQAIYAKANEIIWRRQDRSHYRAGSEQGYENERWNHRIQSQKGVVQRWILTAHKHAEIAESMSSMVCSQHSVLLYKERHTKKKM